MADIRLQKLAKLLVEYSTEVKAGDKVYIRAEEVAVPYMIEVAKEAIQKGAFVQYVVAVPEIGEALYRYGSEDQVARPDDFWGECVRKGDVWLTAWGSRNLKALTSIDPQKLQRRSIANKENHKIYVDRTASGDLRWCGTQYPTHADAQEAGMSLSEYEDFVYGAGLLDHEDPVGEWKKIEAAQERWIIYLDTKKELHIVSEGTDIKVKIDGRKWINCCGKVNFPDGEVFTSPVETDIHGHITFSFPAIYGGREVEGVYLEVEAGKVVKATAAKGEDLLHAYLDTDAGSRYFGEVAIGTNYGITQFTKNILFDEKIGGTIHMAIGSAMPEAGGVNESSIHWDMICDMRKGGRIYADGELFYENGQFIEGILRKYNL